MLEHVPLFAICHTPFSLYLTYLIQGMLEHAIADCNLAINFDPTFAKAFLRRAELRIRTGKRFPPPPHPLSPPLPPHPYPPARNPHPPKDIAVLKIRETNLPRPIAVGASSELQVSEWVN